MEPLFEGVSRESVFKSNPSVSYVPRGRADNSG